MKKCSSEQQFCKFDMITFVALKFWSQHLAQLNLMAGWEADKMRVNFNFLKFAIEHFDKLLRYYSSMNALKLVFLAKPVLRWLLRKSVKVCKP